MLERSAARTHNAHGKSATEIPEHLEIVEPLLRAGCDIEFDTSKFSVQQFADKPVRLVAQ